MSYRDHAGEQHGDRGKKRLRGKKRKIVARRELRRLKAAEGRKTPWFRKSAAIQNGERMYRNSKGLEEFNSPLVRE